MQAQPSNCIIVVVHDRRKNSRKQGCPRLPAPLFSGLSWSFSLLRSTVQNYTFRLTPGQDLFDSIQAFVMEKHVQAGCVLSGVGSLRHATIRLANQNHIPILMDPLKLFLSQGLFLSTGLICTFPSPTGTEGRSVGILSLAARFIRLLKL